MAKGIACWDHTCNIPLLNHMVVAVISIPCVVSPDVAQEFKIAVEQIAQYSFEAQVENRKQLLQELAPPVLNASAATPAYPVPHPVEKELSNKRAHASVPSQQALDLQKVEGYKMEKNRKKKRHHPNDFFGCAMDCHIIGATHSRPVRLGNQKKPNAVRG